MFLKLHTFLSPDEGRDTYSFWSLRKNVSYQRIVNDYVSSELLDSICYSPFLLFFFIFSSSSPLLSNFSSYFPSPHASPINIFSFTLSLLSIFFSLCPLSSPSSLSPHSLFYILVSSYRFSLLSISFSFIFSFSSSYCPDLHDCAFRIELRTYLHHLPVDTDRTANAFNQEIRMTLQLLYYGHSCGESE
jgi:hypothetical protein